MNLVDALFSNHVIGQLFLDSEGHLTLAIAPSPKKWEANQPIRVQREVLLEGIDSMEFSFYAPPAQETEAKGEERCEKCA